MRQQGSLRFFMQEVLELAKNAEDVDEVPVGAIVVKDGRVIGRGYNQVKKACNPVGHAEILAIQEAATALSSQMLYECDLYVSLEPCMMCSAAISLARIRNVYFGAYDQKSGKVISNQTGDTFLASLHKTEWYGGIMEEECREILKKFFKGKRE